MDKITPSPAIATISRVKKFDISNFRGLIGQHRFNFDADLVLIEGPNGYGKSSLLEALLWLVTGYPYIRSNEDSEIVSRRLGAEPGSPTHYENCTLEADCSYFSADFQSNNGQFNAKVNFGAKNQETFTPRVGDLESGALINGFKVEDRTLLVRLCSFFQEKTELVFDEYTRGQTLQAILSELPSSVLSTEDKLQDLIDDLKREKEHYPGLEGKKSDVEMFRKRCGDFIESINQFRSEHSINWPELRYSRDIDFASWQTQCEQYLRSFIRDKSETLQEVFFNALDLAVNSEVQRLERLGKYSKETKLEQLKLQFKLVSYRDELEEKNRQWPNLEKELNFFLDSRLAVRDEITPQRVDPALINSVDILFDILADNAERWGGETPEELAFVKEQFGRIKPDLAAQCGKAIRDWLAPRRRDWARITFLDENVRKIETRLKELQDIGKAVKLELDWKALSSIREDFKSIWESEYTYMQAQEKHRARDHINKQIRALSKLNEIFGIATQPGNELRNKIAVNTTRVLHRFSLVEGFLPLHIEAQGRLQQAFEPRTNDGRKLSDLSTGQKAQTAVSLMAAQNLSLKGLPRVMILDDVSTSYDLSNLTREALLWRQLAYGGEGEHQRQVFISSHHEDLTQGLLDLLTPPEGKTMHLIRFKSWNAKSGPEVEQYVVDPTGRAWESGKDNEPSKALKTFAEALCNQFG